MALSKQTMNYQS